LIKLANEENLGKIIVELELLSKQFQQGLKDAKGQLGGFEKEIAKPNAKILDLNNSFKALGKGLSGGFGLGLGIGVFGLISGAVQQTVNFIKESIGAFAEWEQTLLKVSSATGIAVDSTVEFGGSVDTLSGHIKSISSSISATYADTAKAVVELSKAGYNVTEALSAVDDTVKFSKAGFLSLNEAIDLTTATMQTFGLAAEQTAYVQDVLLKQLIRQT
jgi:predicted lipid-binding transport protein (Tim44 family)